jgi:2-iminobutanoate/2-iminopropanoate deaminase
MKKIQTDKAPTAVGHYSQGIAHNGLIFVSGQVATNPATGEKVVSSIEAQAEQALQNVEAVLQASASDWHRVLKMTICVSGMGHWSAVKARYAKILDEHPPARAIIPVGNFGNGLLIEIEAIAVAQKWRGYLLSFALITENGAPLCLNVIPQESRSNQALCWITNKMLRSMTFPFYFCKHQ